MSFSEWREVKLEECAECIFSGGTPSTKIPAYWNGEFPWLSSGETRNTFIYETEKKITQEGIDNSSTKLAKKDDVVIASAGQGNTRGQTSICKIDTYINQSIISIRSNQKKMDPYYLFYNIYGRYNELRKISDGHSIRGSLTTKIIKDLYIKILPLEEQKAIAHILSTLDDKIEVNNQINKTLENMAQAIFKQWFVDFEFPNEDGEPYRSSGGEMVESELGMIPKGWEVGKFIDLIEITSGKRPGKRSELAMEDSKYPLVGASSIMGYTDDFNFEEKILVIGRVGTHGVVQRINNKVWASDNTLVIKSDNYEFAYQILNQIDYKAINRGSTQPLITQTDIKNYTLIIPTEVYLSKFELLVGSLFEIHSNHCIENSKLTEIRDSLLPKLMSGEIRVPLDEEGDAS